MAVVFVAPASRIAAKKKIPTIDEEYVFEFSENLKSISSLLSRLISNKH